MRCPRCQQETEKVTSIDLEVREILLKHQSADAVYSRVCGGCIQLLTQHSVTPSLIEDKVDPEELKKMVIWRSRGDAIKSALFAMKDKNYEQALVSYLSYIKILEDSFSTPRSALTAKVFEEKGKPEELTTYIFALWDLIEIYDRGQHEQQAEISAEFAKLVKGTAMNKTMARKARIAARDAKNPALYKQLNKELGGGRSCFIATAVFGNTFAPEVLRLREFRDQVLETSVMGRIFIRAYYIASPSLSILIQRSPILAEALRPTLRTIADHLQSNIFEVYTDGSLKKNLGSWAYIILKNGRIIYQASGVSKGTTSQKMEIQAAIEALQKTPPGAKIKLFSDSRMLVTTVVQDLAGWQKNDWRKSNGRPVPHVDQMKVLADLTQEREVSWKWIPAHRGSVYNEKCDQMCILARTRNT
jgi:ribonuclease HI